MIKRDKCLDRHAQMFGIKRKRYFILFKESDEKLRKRIVNYTDVMNRRIKPFPCNECVFYYPKEDKCIRIFGKSGCKIYRAKESE